MAQYPTVKNQVIELIQRAGVCDLEEITHHCTNLTWSQVFLAVDGLSRSSQLRLMSRGRVYIQYSSGNRRTVGRIHHHSHHNHKEVCHV